MTGIPGGEGDGAPVGGGAPDEGGVAVVAGFAGFTEGSTWGSVKPHFVQKRAPSLASSPQWRQTVIQGGQG